MFSTKNKFYLIICFVQFIGFGCTDKAVLYRKDYDPGKHTHLRFDGYYAEPPFQVDGADSNKRYFSPLFFYRDGSAVWVGLFPDTAELSKRIVENPKGIWGFWGNYQLNGDTLAFEYFAPNGGTWTAERMTRKAIVSGDQLHFFERKNRDNVSFDYNTHFYFHKFQHRPDSTENWVRRHRKNR